ncbi:MAG: fructosamine kinase family protein [Clostridia bacterium]
MRKDKQKLDEKSQVNASLERKVSELFSAKIEKIESVGSGISGNISKVTIDKPPYVLAVKVAKDGVLLRKESDWIEFIYKKVDIKLPRIYATNIEENNNFLLMQYFDGIACSDKKVLRASKKIRANVAMQLADNIARLQQITNDKFGELENPRFDNWLDCYKPFAIDMLAKAPKLVADGVVRQNIVDVMRLAFANFDKIFDGQISAPTLIHGDYWAANTIVDSSFRLIGVVDPFKSMWADGEYELFALNAVFGDKLPVLEAFLSKHSVSKNFAVKNEFYLLFSEFCWVTIMRHDNNKYLSEICKRLVTQLKNLQ